MKITLLATYLIPLAVFATTACAEVKVSPQAKYVAVVECHERTNQFSLITNFIDATSKEFIERYGLSENSADITVIENGDKLPTKSSYTVECSLNNGVKVISDLNAKSIDLQPERNEQDYKSYIVSSGKVNVDVEYEGSTIARLKALETSLKAISVNNEVVQLGESLSRPRIFTLEQLRKSPYIPNHRIDISK